MVMLTLDFAHFATEGIGLYRDICRLDEDWRERVHNKEIKRDPAFEKQTRRILANWLVSQEAIMEAYKEFEDEYILRKFNTKPIEKLRALCREVRDRLEADKMLLPRKGLFELANAATDEPE